jgi:hypothetical protein
MNIKDLPEEDPNGSFKQPRLLEPNSQITISVTKTVCYEVPNGELRIISVGNTRYVEYHNPLYKNSPFKLKNTCFSTALTVQQICESSEVVKFLSRFN